MFVSNKACCLFLLLPLLPQALLSLSWTLSCCRLCAPRCLSESTGPKAGASLRASLHDGTAAIWAVLGRASHLAFNF